MTRAQRSRAARRLAIGSALFSMVRGDAVIHLPAVAVSSLPGL